MVIKNFEELINKVKKFDKPKKVVVVCAHDEHTLEAIYKAEKNKIITSILIGDEKKIKEILSKLSFVKDDKDIINSGSDSDAANKAVEITRENKVDFIMKGKIQTADLLKAVVDKEKGLRTGKIMSHIAFTEIPNYHKILVTTDGGMMMYPNLEEKKQILENAVETLISMGYENPKVAVLAAVEKVNPKMQETIDADALKKMNMAGKIKNCIVEGPISYDLTVCKESGDIKNYNSPVAGDADILIVPNITTGNILVKSLVYSAKAKMAGFIVGARTPIVLTSRGSTSEEKYLSLVLCSALV